MKRGSFAVADSSLKGEYVPPRIGIDQASRITDYEFGGAHYRMAVTMRIGSRMRPLPGKGDLRESLGGGPERDHLPGEAFNLHPETPGQGIRLPSGVRMGGRG